RSFLSDPTVVGSSPRRTCGCRSPPRLELTVAPCPFPACPCRLEVGKHVVVGLVRRELHPKIESGRPQQAKQRVQRRLSLAALIRRDHGGRDARTLCQLPLGQPSLQASQLQKSSPSRRRGLVIRLCHNTIVSLIRKCQMPC